MLNISKDKKAANRWKTKYFLCIFVPIFILISIATFAGYRIDVNSSRRLHLADEEHLTSLYADTITDFLNFAINDLILLSGNHEITNIFIKKQGRGLLDLGVDLVAYCERKPFCSKVRVLDTDGMEILKVSNDGDKALMESADKLRLKSEQDYFKEALKINRGEVYVSPMESSVQEGRVEEARRPVIRIATPSFANGGEKLAVIVVSLFGDQLLEKVKSLASGPLKRPIVINSEGFMLFGGRGKDDYAFTSEDGKERNLAKLYPETWRRISGNETGQFYGSRDNTYNSSDGIFSVDAPYLPESGLYTFVTLNQSGDSFNHSKGRLANGDAFVKVKGKTYWKIISYLPPKVISATPYTKYLLIYGLFVGLLSLACSHLTRGKASRREAEERVRSHEVRYRMLHDSAFDGIIICDSGGIIVESNKSMEKTFGYDENELVGKPVSVLVPDSSRQYHDDGFDRYIETRQKNIFGRILQREALCKNGEVIPIELSISELNINGSLFLAGTVRDISERMKSEATIQRLAYYDHLTDLPNRSLFIDRLSQAIARARRNDLLTGILFLDFDRFKSLNDTLGHQVGDSFLKEVAERLSKNSRASDSVARIGGDEFVIFVSDKKSIDDVLMVAEKVCSIFTKPFKISGHEFFMSTSVGISVFPADGEDVTTLMKKADTAMYQAKADGGGCFHLYSPAMNEKATERLKLEGKLKKALDKNEFFLHYQPQIDTKSGRMIGAEALLRWQESELGLISPSKFIPLAEATRLIVPIGEWLLRSACKETIKLHDEGLEKFSIAVNVSLSQLKEKGFPETVAKILEETGLEPEYLELEITETVAMDNVKESVKVLDELKAIGVQLSIDDFGTGYSSLEHLRRMPIDLLKIDMSFIKNIVENPDDRKIVSTIIGIAHGFNSEVIAEGVESIEQLKLLTSLGCDKVQGFFFSKPVPASELKDCYNALKKNKIITIDSARKIS